MFTSTTRFGLTQALGVTFRTWSSDALVLHNAVDDWATDSS